MPKRLSMYIVYSHLKIRLCIRSLSQPTGTIQAQSGSHCIRQISKYHAKTHITELFRDNSMNSALHGNDGASSGDVLHINFYSFLLKNLLTHCFVWICLFVVKYLSIRCAQRLLLLYSSKCIILVRDQIGNEVTCTQPMRMAFDVMLWSARTFAI